MQILPIPMQTSPKYNLASAEPLNNMKKSLRLLYYGVFVWIVPFVVSFLFYDASGVLQTSEDLFKSSMIVVSGIAGSVALLRYFRKIDNNFIAEGWTAGTVWLALNLLLDLLILVPFANMPIPKYFASIGLRYLQILIMSVLAGLLVAQNRNRPI